MIPIGASNAERQRRFRAHKRGDHSLCPATRDCDAVTPVASVTAVTSPGAQATRSVPKLGARGRRLWRELAAGKPGPAQLVLVEEACRIADRLDRLDAVLNGTSDAWLRFQVNDDGDEVTVVVDRVLSEARQQAVALKQIVSELRQSAAGKDQPAAQGGSLRDELAAARARRLADAAGR